MATYTVTHICGHEAQHVLFGPHKSRKARREHLERLLCYACWHAELKTYQQQANSEAAAWAAQVGLPTLTGSEKQVAWAESLRMAALGGYFRHFLDGEGTLRKLGQNALAANLEALTLAQTVADTPHDPTAWLNLADWLRETGHTEAADLAAATIWVLGQAEAKWWIESRHQDVITILRHHIRHTEPTEKE